MKKSEIDSLLTEVETALTAALKEEQTKLAKAHPGEESSSEEPSDTSATDPKEPEASVSPPPGDGATDASPAPDASASVSPEATGPADASVPPADGSAPADPAADQSNDPQALQDEYSKLGAADPEALKNHYLACKAALFALMGAGADASAPPAAPVAPVASPAAPMAPPVASPSPSAPPAMKSEKSAGGMPTTTEAANGGQGMMKSEKEIKDLTDKLAKQEEAMAGLLTLVTSVVETPVRKAITSIAHMAKTEDEKSSKEDFSKLSKSEVKAKLRLAAEKPLRKSDRELINSFDLGNIGVDKVAHLIK
jgi:hypothetical protein